MLYVDTGPTGVVRILGSAIKVRSKRQMLKSWGISKERSEGSALEKLNVCIGLQGRFWAGKCTDDGLQGDFLLFADLSEARHHVARLVT